jgi:hypothetical protein
LHESLNQFQIHLSEPDELAPLTKCQTQQIMQASPDRALFDGPSSEFSHQGKVWSFYILFIDLILEKDNGKLIAEKKNIRAILLKKYNFKRKNL